LSETALGREYRKLSEWNWRERERTESHTNVHLFERTLVVATCLVERKEK
jgi:hypothetical protein